MGFMDAVKSVYSNYANFNGRARRSEYWFYVLFYVIAYTVLFTVETAIGGFGLLAGLFALANIIPMLAAGVRRLHDTGKSGWWILIGLVPLVGFIVLLIFYVKDSDPGTNAYGPNPKGVAGDATVAG